jgi:hypothetical protein
MPPAACPLIYTLTHVFDACDDGAGGVQGVLVMCLAIEIE